MGSTMPWGYSGAEPTIIIVLSVMASAMASTSARKSGLGASLTTFMSMSSAGAVEGGVGRSGHEDFRRAVDGLVGPGPVSGGLDGEEYALGAAGGHASGGPVAAVEKGEAKVDNLFFHPGEAGKDFRVDGVFVEVHGIGVVGDLDNVVAGIVEEAGYLAGAPVYVSPTAFGEAVLEFVPAGARLWK